MRRQYVLILLMALFSCATTTMAFAEETITVTSTGSDISESLDLKAVASLFGEVQNLEAFETELNSPERHINNLDLNGDGQVDYLRVVEMTENGGHLIIIQAVLAKDIYQDVASIFVEKDANDQVSVQVIGDEYVYGSNYVIEPVYIYRPVIYDWFWGPSWVCWHSPYYWGFYPHGWCYYDVWAWPVYASHIHVYHHDHYCSFRYAAAPRAGVGRMYASPRARELSHRDMAASNVGRSFQERNAGMTNARGIQAQRRTQALGATPRTAAQTATPSRVAQTGASRSVQASASRSAQMTDARRGSSFTRTSSAPSVARSTSAPAAARSANAASTTARSTSTSATVSRSTAAPAQRGYRSAGSATASRSYTTTSSTPSRSSSVASTPSRSSSSASSYSSHSGYSRSSSVSSGYSGSSRSSSFSRSASMGGGYSGGSRGGYSGGGGSHRGR